MPCGLFFCRCRPAATVAAFCLLAALAWATGCRKDTLHWQQHRQLASGTDNQLNRIFFLTDSVGFAVGGARYANATILRTKDGGATWQAFDLPEAGKILYAICRGPGGRLYASGLDAKLLTSDDTGSTWQFLQLPTWRIYKCAAFSRSGRGVFAGGVSFEQGILSSYQADATLLHTDSLGFEINDLAFVPGTDTGYLCGYGTVMKSIDGGATWQQCPGATADNFTAMQLVGDSGLWLCGAQGSVYHSTNGGATFTQLRNGNSATRSRYRLMDILMITAEKGYAVGEDGLVIFTDDAGRHWMEYDRFTHATLRSVAQLPGGDILVCGDSGELWQIR